MAGYSYRDLALGAFLVTHGVIILVPGLAVPGALAGILALAAGVLIFIK